MLFPLNHHGHSLYKSDVTHYHITESRTGREWIIFYLTSKLHFSRGEGEEDKIIENTAEFETLSLF